MRRSPRPGSCTSVLVLALGIVACSDPTGPGSASVDGLTVALSLTPTVVEQHESFLAELTIRNTRPDTATLHSGCSTIAWIGLYREGERVSARGTDFGCFAVLTEFEIPPGEVLRREWMVTAERPDGAAIPRGAYTFRVEFQVSELPDLERTLRVQ